MAIRFEWDPDKAASNWQKHGLRFETALQVFFDLEVLFEQDRVVEGEPRWQAIGLIDGIVLAAVAHVFQEESGDEIVRIISARRADRYERRRYDEATGSIHIRFGKPARTD